MKFLCGRSLHTVNGLIALLLWIQVLALFQKKKDKKTLVTDLARAGAFIISQLFIVILFPRRLTMLLCALYFLSQ